MLSSTIIITPWQDAPTQSHSNQLFGRYSQTGSGKPTHKNRPRPFWVNNVLVCARKPSKLYEFMSDDLWWPSVQEEEVNRRFLIKRNCGKICQRKLATKLCKYLFWSIMRNFHSAVRCHPEDGSICPKAKAGNRRIPETATPQRLFRENWVYNFTKNGLDFHLTKFNCLMNIPFGSHNFFVAVRQNQWAFDAHTLRFS